MLYRQGSQNSNTLKKKKKFLDPLKKLDAFSKGGGGFPLKNESFLKKIILANYHSG